MKQIVRIIPLLLLLTGCGNGDKQIGGSGLLETDEVLISAETSGRVIRLMIDEGMSLRESDTLLVIDPSRLMLELQAAQAGHKVALAQHEVARVMLDQRENALHYASSELKRVVALKDAGTATAKQYDKINYEQQQAATAYRAAQANLAIIDAELDKITTEIARINRAMRDCYPVSPASGTVVERYVEKGELLAAGKPIARVARLDTMWVKVYLPSGDFSSVKIGDRATVDTEAGEKSYRGVVTWTSDEAEFTPKNVQTRQSRAALVYAVKVRLANSDGNLKIGMPVFVTLGQ